MRDALALACQKPELKRFACANFIHSVQELECLFVGSAADEFRRLRWQECPRLFVHEEEFGVLRLLLEEQVADNRSQVIEERNPVPAAAQCPNQVAFSAHRREEVEGRTDRAAPSVSEADTFEAWEELY